MRNYSPMYDPLTQYELNALTASLSSKEFQHDVFRAFLFVCATGLSWEDVYLLKWTQVDRENSLLVHEYERINGHQTQCLSQFALNVLPKQKSSKVFPDLHIKTIQDRYSKWGLFDLWVWGMKSNIKRRFCLETARPTFVAHMRAQLFDEHEIANMLNITESDLRSIYPFFII
ncbi:TPA: hypothetical protein OL568_002366 [Citrobacter freundii]|nr:hypothetical protein [Salmonella enterica subsp. enterica serovar Carmel]HCQ6559549.1 hypothetical protein [Citrobacter freundii]